ncbi:hypothetical protein EV182_002675, partial [Spiromyces aspiralis]
METAAAAAIQGMKGGGPTIYGGSVGVALIQARSYGSKKKKDKKKSKGISDHDEEMYVGEGQGKEGDDMMALDLDKTAERMSKDVERLGREFQVMRAGRANPAILDQIRVSIEGSLMKLSELAMVSMKDAHTLLVIPHDEEMLKAIEKAIWESGLGLNPMPQKNGLKVPVPKATKETRQKLVKEIAAMAEKTRVHIRKHRQDAMKKLKTDSKEGMSKDEVKQWEKA